MKMTKRILSVVLAAVLCMVLSMSAFAGSSSKNATISGTSGSLNVRAGLTVNENTGTATTTAGTSDGVRLITSITYSYRDRNTGHIVTQPTQTGAGSASSGNSTRSGVKATSQHTIHSDNNDKRWGNWNVSLEASAS